MSTLQLGLKTTFREKLEWLEAAETLSLRLQAARQKIKIPPPKTGLSDSQRHRT